MNNLTRRSTLLRVNQTNLIKHLFDLANYF